MLLLWLLPLDNVLRTGLSIIACCPAGSLAAVLAKQTGTEATLASQAVAHSTVCMLVTVPAMLLLTRCDVPDVRSCKKARCLWTAGFLLL